MKSPDNLFDKHRIDGCYRLGQPARIDDKMQTVGNDKHKGRIAWPRFQQLVDEFVLKVSKP